MKKLLYVLPMVVLLQNCGTPQQPTYSETKETVRQINLIVNNVVTKVQAKETIKNLKKRDFDCSFTRQITLSTLQDSFGSAFDLRAKSNDGTELKLVNDYGWKFKKTSDLSGDKLGYKNLKMGALVVEQNLLIWKRTGDMNTPYLSRFESIIKGVDGSDFVATDAVDMSVSSGASSNTLTMEKYGSETRLCLAAIGAQHDVLDREVAFRSSSGDGTSKCITFVFDKKETSTPNLLLAAHNWIDASAPKPSDAALLCK